MTRRTIPVTLDIQVEAVFSVELDANDADPTQDSVELVSLTRLKLVQGKLDPTTGRVRFTYQDIPPSSDFQEAMLVAALWDSAASAALDQLAKERP